MKPVDQTIFGWPSGNCFAACVASILELSLDEVPNFMLNHETWFDDTYRWLAARGYTVLYVKRDAVASGQVDPRPLIEAGHYFILGGLSPRGEHLHCVIEHRNVVVHDPHPSRAGLVSAWEDFMVILPNGLTDKPAQIIPPGSALGKYVDELRAERDEARRIAAFRSGSIAMLLGTVGRYAIAAREVLRSFGYPPGRGPDWYEATRKAVEEDRQ